MHHVENHVLFVYLQRQTSGVRHYETYTSYTINENT